MLWFKLFLQYFPYLGEGLRLRPSGFAFFRTHHAKFNPLAWHKKGLEMVRIDSQGFSHPGGLMTRPRTAQFLSFPKGLYSSSASPPAFFKSRA
jgi:hypothetical protein